MLHPKPDSLDTESSIGIPPTPLSCYPAIRILPSPILLSYAPVPFYNYPAVPLSNDPAITLPSYLTIELSRQPFYPKCYTQNPTPRILNVASGSCLPTILLAR